MTAAEAKQEFEKLAKDSGLTEDQMKAVLQAFDNEKFAKGVGTGYARHSEYSSALDKLKNAESKIGQYEDKIGQYEDWYTKQAAPAITAAQQVAQRLQQYEAQYGPLDDQTVRDRKAAAGALGVTREELDKVLKERSDASTAAFVEYERQMGDIRLDHFARFGEKMDMDKFEKFMRESKSADIPGAYMKYVEPRMEEKRNKDFEDRIKKERDEAVRDFASRHKIPTETRPEPTSPLEDLMKLKRDKDYDGDSKAKEAFVSAWNEQSSAA